MKKIVLGQTYYVNGREFIPITVEKGKLLNKKSIWADREARANRIYTDAEGKRVGKSKIFETQNKTVKHKTSHL